MRVSKLSAGDFKRLFKLPISGLSALSAANGYLAWSQELRPALLANAVAVLLLASAASALNEVQERKADAAMERTRRRPVAAGTISVGGALGLAGAVGAAGALLLYASSGAGATLLGLAAVAWYNGIYTPLKRVTAFALLPGALIGALTPAIGWVGAGGSATDGRILALSFFWFIWQVPHFSLLLMAVGNDYARGGFPTLTALFSPPTLARITALWVTATAASALFLPLFGVTTAAWSSLGLFGVSAGLPWLAWRWLRRGIPKAAFHAVNAYALIVMAVGMADALL